MEDSSDDDKPLGARKLVSATANLLGSDSDDGSPVPEWISQATPQKSVVNLADSSDEDGKDRSTQEKLAAKALTQPEVNEGSNIGKRVDKIAPKGKMPGSQSARAKLASSSQHLPPAGASQPLKPVAAIPEAAPGAEIPLVFPDKAQGTRYLVELEGDEDGVADLAGDAGAVGRFTVAGNRDGDREVLLDLKGRIYNTSLMECATTFCVINLQPNEARVEAVLTKYVSLREDERHNQQDEKNPFMYDDDDADAYQIEDEDKANLKPGKRKAKEDPEIAPKPKKKAAAKPAPAKRKTAAKKPAGKAGSRIKKK